MENSTLTHEEHQKDPYNTLKATRQYNNTLAEYEAEEAELGRQRKELGASIYTLEAELQKEHGEYTKASMEKILNERRKKVKELEVNLDAVIAQREGLSITDFMGEGDRTPKQPSADLRRSTMSDADKVAYIAKHSMADYLKLQY